MPSEKEKSSYSNMLVPVAIVLAGLAIGGAIVYTNSSGETKGVQSVEPEYKYQKYVNVAKDISLDDGKFKSCMDKFDAGEVKADLADASKYGASGTPTFFIGKNRGGKEFEAVKLVGAQPYDVFATVVEALTSGTAKDAIAALPKNQQVDRSGNPVTTQVVSIDDDPVQGSDVAPVMFIDFSDYECPFCKRFFQGAYRQIKQNYVDTGMVKYVFRDLPLSFHDPVATEEAVAANCAREQGGDQAYVKYHDEVFNRTRSNGKGM